MAESLGLVDQLKGMDPEEALSFIRRLRSTNSFEAFIQYYFPHFTRTEPAKCHRDFIDDIEDMTLRNMGGNRKVYAAPRGSAKSTFFTVFYPLWCIVTGRKHFIIIMSDAEDQAISQLRKIKTELEENSLLIEDFGNLVGSEWGATSFITATNTMVLALGSTQRIRGRGHGPWRPDLIILDDIENDKNVRSEIQRKELEERINEAVTYAGDMYTDIVLIGTILHQESLLAKKLRNPLWTPRLYRSVISWSSRQDLWEVWEHILTDLGNPNRQKDSDIFYYRHETDMLEGTDVLWPTKESYKVLMTELIETGPAAFAKERQNDPTNSEDCPFDPKTFKYYDSIDELVSLYMFIDPSMGEKETSDYSAIIIIGVGQSTQTRYILVADIRRRSPEQIMVDVESYYRQYKFTRVAGEANVFQKFWLRSMAGRIHKAGLSPLPEEVTHSGNKAARIKSLQPEIINGFLKFGRNQQELLIRQLTFFPLDAHDDGPDALEACYRLSQSQEGFSFGSL